MWNRKIGVFLATGKVYLWWQNKKMEKILITGNPALEAWSIFFLNLNYRLPGWLQRERPGPALRKIALLNYADPLHKMRVPAAQRDLFVD
jgi:hypothetical protein